MTTALIIGLCLIVLFWLSGKFRKGMAVNDNFITQMKFLQMYMLDNTEKLFYNKSEEDAIEMGQEMLWAAADDFHARMDRAVNKKVPVQVGDTSILMLSIKIIKVAEALVYIQKNGAIQYDGDEESVVETNEENETSD